MAPQITPQTQTSQDTLANDTMLTTTLGGVEGDEKITASLDFVRTHLGMEVAYLSEFVDENLVFRAVSAPGFEDIVAKGGTMPLDQVYCPHILSGRLPELIPDTTAIPLCNDIALTHSVPIRSHVSIPIKRNDGSTYGMFCCLSREKKPDLTERDLEVMRAFANLSSDQINSRYEVQNRLSKTRSQIENVLRDRCFHILYQPIMDAETQIPVGFEALCRFDPMPYRPPNIWFEQAGSVGLQERLEIAVISKALTALEALPPEVYLSVNASPDTVASGAFLNALANAPCERLVVEITEHSQIETYDLLLEQVNLLRFKGVRIAIDDAGAGYSGLQQIVQLRPDIIKLDMSLTSNINKDVVRRSLSAALVNFASEIDASIVAEGVENIDELEALRNLGVPLAQGFYLGRPQDLATACEWFRAPKATGSD